MGVTLGFMQGLAFSLGCRECRGLGFSELSRDSSWPLV